MGDVTFDGTYEANMARLRERPPLPDDTLRCAPPAFDVDPPPSTIPVPPPTSTEAVIDLESEELDE
jgi:hypothetical protein